jgi:outer membrane protein assembly factor BamB
MPVSLSPAFFGFHGGFFPYADWRGWYSIPNMRLNAICAALLIGVCHGTAQSPSTEWTRFRGPNGSGIAEAANIPAEWTERDYRWKIALPGRGHSSPVVFSDKVFVTCADNASATRMVLCVGAKDGAVLWRKQFDSEPFKKHRDNSFATSTPAVDAKHIYIYWTTPKEITLMALDHDGKEAWQRSLGPFASQHGSGTSPIVYGNKVILGNEQEGEKSSLLALDTATGATRWTTPRRSSNAAYSTPFVRLAADGAPELIFSGSSHGVSALDPESGAIRWEYATAFPLRVVGSSIAAGELIVGTCGEGGIGRRLVALKPPAIKGGTAELVYELNKAGIPYVPTPLEKDGLLFLWGDNGLVSCLRTATGEKLWQEKLEDSFYGSPIWVRGHLYCVSQKGVVHVLAAASRYQLLGRNDLGEGSHATPAADANSLFLRTFTHLMAIGAAAIR